MLSPAQEQILFGILAQAEEQTRLLVQIAQAHEPPFRKPLLCHFGIHRPHSLMVGVNREACHRCGYSWKEHWSARLIHKRSPDGYACGECQARRIR